VADTPSANLLSRYPGVDTSLPSSYQSHLICLDPAIQICPIEVDPPTLAHHYKLSSVDEMLDGLLGAPVVGGRIFDCEKPGCGPLFSIAALNLWDDFRGKLGT
jgi:hypothetical protein